MAPQTTQQIDAAQLIARIAEGEFSQEFLLVVARGLLPVEQEDLVGILACLSGNEDEEVAEVAVRSLVEMPTKAILAWVRGDKATDDLLTRLASAIDDVTVTEAILRNRRTSDATIVEIARKAPPGLQEVIVINQERLLRAPEILEALLANPSISADIHRRLIEFRQEFVEKAKPERRPVEEVEEEPEDLSPIADLLEKAARVTEAQAPAFHDVPIAEGEERSVIVRLLTMSVSERVQRAFRGDRTERTILVRDRNRLVCSAVLRSPKLSEQEVEQYAGMRNVDDEVLRLIGMRRDWTAKYGIAVTLCRNPKAPLGVVLPLLHRLTLRDLKELSRDKNVQEGVRLNSKKLYVARSQK